MTRWWTAKFFPWAALALPFGVLSGVMFAYGYLSSGFILAGGGVVAWGLAVLDNHPEHHTKIRKALARLADPGGRRRAARTQRVLVALWRSSRLSDHGSAMVEIADRASLPAEMCRQILEGFAERGWVTQHVLNPGVKRPELIDYWRLTPLGAEWAEAAAWAQSPVEDV